VKISVDTAAGGALMGKSIEAAKALLKEMASNNYHWSNERAALKRGGGRHEVDAVTLLASRVDTHWIKLLPHQSLLRGHQWGPIHTVKPVVYRDTSIECYNAPPSIEHVNAFHNYNPPPQNNPPDHL